jgi:signal transduction histidine kinase
MDKKCFYLMEKFKEAQEAEAANKGVGEDLPQYSLSEIMELCRERPAEDLMFTSSKAIAGHKKLSQMQQIIKDLQKDGDNDFKVFMARCFELETSQEEEDLKVGNGVDRALMLIDMSKQALLESISIERTYMTYMNSTVSHEMRNPLNAIVIQILFLHGLHFDLKDFIERVKHKLDEDEVQELEEIVADMRDAT